MDNILDTIGRTPLVEIKKLNPNPAVKIFAKLEGFNPGGSMKDRVARALIEDAEISGALKKGKTIIEATNGNTGIGIAMVAAIKGYKTIIVSPENANQERKRIIESFGAQVIEVKPELWRQGALDLVEEMAAKDSSLVVLDKFSAKQNCAVHFNTTGKEIVKQISGQIDYFISCIGTGGAISGIARQLRQNWPQVRVIGIQPKIWGADSSIETGIFPPILNSNLPCGDHDKVMVDIIVEIGQADAFQMAERIIREEGIFAGASSGAAMFTAAEYAKKMEKGTIVTVFPDRGEHYLSTEMFRN
jgi:cysteine synthase